MSICQNEPFFDLASNLSAILLAQVPQLQQAKIGWPDRKWFQVETNLPGVFLVDISETGRHAVSQFATHREVKNADGTGQIITEKLRLRTLLQISLFTNTKGDREQLGWQIKQYLIANYRLPILDYTQATPTPTGEHMMLYYRGDHKELRGEANFWQRDLTFEVQSRVLDAVPGHSASRIVVSQTLLTDPAATPPQ